MKNKSKSKKEVEKYKELDEQCTKVFNFCIVAFFIFIITMCLIDEL